MTAAQDEPMGERVDLAQFDGHTAGPWQIARRDFPGTINIESPATSRAVAAWRTEDPSRAQNRFEGVNIARLGQGINGSGPAYGPKYLIDEDELEANARLIIAAPALAAEVRRFREWKARNEAAAEEVADIYVEVCRERDNARAESSRLREENERLAAEAVEWNKASVEWAEDSAALRYRLEVAEEALLTIRPFWMTGLAVKTVDVVLATLRGKDAKPAEPAPAKCPHCKAGHPLKAPAGSMNYHIIPEGRDGYTYAVCKPEPPAEPAAQEGLCTRDCGLPHRHLTTACAPLAPPPAASPQPARTRCFRESICVCGTGEPHLVLCHEFKPCGEHAEGPARSEQ